MFKGTQKSDITDQHDRYPLLDTSHSTTAASIHDRPLRIGSSVTPYRLLNIVVLLGLGQSFAAGNLDWAGGLFATVTLYYVATYDGEKGPPWTNRFFRTDLSRPTFVKKILLRRSIFALVFNAMLGTGTYAMMVVLSSLGMSTDVNLIRVAFCCSLVGICGIFLGGEAFLRSLSPSRMILLFAFLLSALSLSWLSAFMFLHIYGGDHVYRTFHLDGWEDL